MSELLATFKEMLKLIEKTEEGNKLLNFLDREFQFQGDGYTTFIVNFRPGKEITLEEKEKKYSSFLETTVVDISEQDLLDILKFKARPSEAYFGNKLKMSDMMACGSYNHTLLRLLRIGQEQLVINN